MVTFSAQELQEEQLYSLCPPDSKVVQCGVGAVGTLESSEPPVGPLPTDL